MRKSGDRLSTKYHSFLLKEVLHQVQFIVAMQEKPVNIFFYLTLKIKKIINHCVKMCNFGTIFIHWNYISAQLK